MARGFSILLLSLSFGVGGASLFLSPGQDAFEGIGYLFGGILLLLASTSAVTSVLTSRVRGEAWALLFVSPAVVLFALAAAMG